MPYLRQREVGVLDSLYMDSLASSGSSTIETDAPDADEGRDQQPGQEQPSPTKVARRRIIGGKLTVHDFLRWVRVLPPQVTGQLKTAPDSMLTRFATDPRPPTSC